MSVLCEGISVVVPVHVVEARYPGGLAGYRTDVPNASFRTDGWLTRVGFLDFGDVARWLDLLMSVGLTPVDRRGRFQDLAVVDDVHGVTLPCPWLETGVVAGLPAAWLAGAGTGEPVAPGGAA